ncbi:MAG: DNA alkylation repair protein [Clostridia bacterium]|nr:DNA alkylation repair protein [Clostridia bacterium]
MITEEIKDNLFELRDEKYRDFQAGLIPTVPRDRFIGVRTPDLRRLAKESAARNDVGVFLAELPHRYFDENQLHAFILSGMKDYDRCIAGVDSFLPFVDNWATCDQMSPKIFKKHKPELLGKIDGWIASDKTYTVRFAVGMLMEHFLGEDFDPAYPAAVASIRSEEYYVRMMVAWYFATALAKQYDSVLPFIEEQRLDPWTHNRAIRKSVESYRISDDRKEYLRSLKTV